MTEQAQRIVDAYKFVDGGALNERKLWLQDDYVKFIRWAQWRIERTAQGILGFITNHGYLDNPTFRGMRQNLMQSFEEIYLLDLHGNSKKKEVDPATGAQDKNVFDIQQGVAIRIFVKLPPEQKKNGWRARSRRYRGPDGRRRNRDNRNSPRSDRRPRKSRRPARSP